MITMLKSAAFAVALALLCLTSAVSSHAGAATLASNDTHMVMDMGALTDSLKPDKGDRPSKTAFHGKGIEVYGVSFTASLAPIESQTGAQRLPGPNGGTPKLSAIVVEVDQNSEFDTKMLEQVMGSGGNKIIPVVTISYSKTSLNAAARGGQETYFQIKLENVLVSSFELSSDAEGPHVRISLTPEKISFPPIASSATSKKE